MRTRLFIALCAVVLIPASTSLAVSSAIDLLMADYNTPPTPGPGGGHSLLFNQMVGYNTQVALDVYGIAKPNVPSAQLSPGDGIVRAFTQSNKTSGIENFEATLWRDIDHTGSPASAPGQDRFGLAQNAEHWFGWNSTQQGTGILRVQQIIDQVGSSHFAYTFDQNQNNSSSQYNAGDLPASWQDQPDGQLAKYLDDGTVQTSDFYTSEFTGDIWLKGRVILINPDFLPAVQAAADADALTTAVNNLIEGTQKRTFLFDDTTFGDYPDDSEFYEDEFAVPANLGRNWVHLPGTSYYNYNDLDTTQFGTGSGITAISNNGDAAHSDWAGFLLDENGNPLDYADFEDWGFLLEVQGLYDNAGPEEVYIISLGEPTATVIPEPLTMASLLGAFGALGGYLRKRTRRD